MKRHSFRALSCVLMLMAAATARAADIYVNAAGAGTELGTQTSPYRTVQAAIDAAKTGDKILVAAGTYQQNLRIQTKALVLEGGFAADWSRDITQNTTTLSSPGGNSVINIIESDSTIDGFTITGGTGSTEDLPYSTHGGGIYSREGSPTISNNIIVENDIRKMDPPSETNYGGGIYVSNAPNATILNNTIRGNFAGRGSGIAAVGGKNLLIQGNTVEDNVSVGDHGGGMYIGVEDAVITQNVIRGNEVGRELGYGWGGGLIFFNSGNSAEISFNVVYENFAAAYGAGEFIDEGATANIHHELIYRNVSKAGCEAVSAIAVDGGATGGSNVTIDHYTIANNVCENSTRGNGLQVEDRSVVTVTNSIFWNNGGDDFATDGNATLNVTYTASQEAIGGTGNITADPRFVKPSADDFHLAANSPCIDAGDPASPFANEPNNNGRADMGRYGNASDAPRRSPPERTMMIRTTRMTTRTTTRIPTTATQMTTRTTTPTPARLWTMPTPFAAHLLPHWPRHFSD
ncbi:MAG: right-handed parallel beta-helix repeat-containing protein [Planctomycetes bacterium]|nr:right-handed parallel beta-helix repeat-containing protein [Planctomycetota bacterium]